MATVHDVAASKNAWFYCSWLARPWHRIVAQVARTLLLLLLLLVTQYVRRLLMQSPIDDDHTSAFRALYTYSSCVCGPVAISPRTVYCPTPLAAAVPH